MSEKTDRQKAKEIAREYFQKNIDNVSTGTEGFPDASSFVYGFMESYLLNQEQLDAAIYHVKVLAQGEDIGLSDITAAKDFLKARGE